MTDPVDIQTTAVEPGRIQQFADFLDELATWWKPKVDDLYAVAEPGSAAYGTLGTSDGTETITAAEQFEMTYQEQTVKPTADTAAALYNQLLHVRAAAIEIADTYSSLEALNTATAQDIQTALDSVPAAPGGVPGVPGVPAPPGGTPPGGGFPTQG